jgi:hypothetical protein
MPLMSRCHNDVGDLVTSMYINQCQGLYNQPSQPVRHWISSCVSHLIQISVRQVDNSTMSLISHPDIVTQIMSHLNLTRNVDALTLVTCTSVSILFRTVALQRILREVRITEDSSEMERDPVLHRSSDALLGMLCHQPEYSSYVKGLDINAEIWNGDFGGSLSNLHRIFNFLHNLRAITIHNIPYPIEMSPASQELVNMLNSHISSLKLSRHFIFKSITLNETPKGLRDSPRTFYSLSASLVQTDATVAEPWDIETIYIHSISDQMQYNIITTFLSISKSSVRTMVIDWDGYRKRTLYQIIPLDGPDGPMLAINTAPASTGTSIQKESADSITLPSTLRSMHLKSSVDPSLDSWGGCISRMNKFLDTVRVDHSISLMIDIRIQCFPSTEDGNFDIVSFLEKGDASAALNSLCDILSPHITHIQNMKISILLDQILPDKVHVCVDTLNRSLGECVSQYTLFRRSEKDVVYEVDSITTNGAVDDLGKSALILDGVCVILFGAIVIDGHALF